MVVAHVQTPYHLFVALGETRAQAFDALESGYLRHYQEFNKGAWDDDARRTALGQFLYFHEDIHYSELQPGECAVDGPAA